MAGFAMMGVDYEGTGVLNLSAVTEYRGHSYAIGADSGAITLPNFMKRYNSKLQGGSVLTHGKYLYVFINPSTKLSETK
jgi:phospholipase B1